MVATERVRAVAGTLARGVLLARLVAAREAIASLLRARATGMRPDATKWFEIADTAHGLFAFVELVPTDLKRATAAEEAQCRDIGERLRTLSAVLVDDPREVNELVGDIDTSIRGCVTELRELESHRKRTLQAAEAGDPVSAAAVAWIDEAFSSEAVDRALSSWRSSERYQAAVSSGLAAPIKSADQPSARTLDAILADLDELVGLDAVKSEVRSLINLLQVNRERESQGLAAAEVSLHVVFAGPPGTGKTTVARLYGELLRGVGLLRKGHLEEVARQDLVAEYIGQTAIKTEAAIDEALDGVLFIDEAYALAPQDARQDFGREAIEVLLKRMEDDRHRLAVIAAGYTAEMQRFIASNPGLESRFTQTIEFPSYRPEELLTIFHRQAGASGFHVDPAAHEAAWRHLYAAWRDRDDHFGNGRYVRRLFEFALRRQANRLAGRANLDELQLTTLIGEDVPGYG